MTAQLIRMWDYRKPEEAKACDERLGRADLRAIEAEIAAALWNSPVYEPPYTAPDKDAS